MSQLFIQLRANKPQHTEGQVISAYSRRRVMQIHSAHLCHVKLAGFTPEGRRPVDSLAWLRWEMTAQYTMMRVSKTEIVRHDKQSGFIETLGRMPKFATAGKARDGNPRRKWQHICVDEYVRARLRHHRHRIFGLEGKEVWHGGRSDFSLTTLTELWNQITQRTGIVCPTWCPAGRLDLKDMLVLPITEDLSDEAAEQLKGKVLDWRSLVPTYLIPRIEDLNRTVDLRRMGYSVSLSQLFGVKKLWTPAEFDSAAREFRGAA